MVLMHDSYLRDPVRDEFPNSPTVAAVGGDNPVGKSIHGAPSKQLLSRFGRVKTNNDRSSSSGHAGALPFRRAHLPAR